jgi:hypothetical protein
MVKLTSEEVLSELYKKLKVLGECKCEFKQQQYPLAEDSDWWHRTDACVYYFNGVINRVNEKNCVFTYGKTDPSWRRIMAKVDEAVMYAKINWKELLENKKHVPMLSDLPEKETIDELTNEQISSIVRYTLKKDYLIYSWNGKLGIRNGFDYKKWDYKIILIPQEFIVERKTSPSDEQKIFYKSDVIQFLVNHVKNVLDLQNL